MERPTSDCGDSRHIYQGDLTMFVTRRSMFTGIERTIDLPVTQEQLDKWTNGALIQDVFPHLTKDQREFIMTGVTDDEWKGTFGDGN